jgi:UPF0755 protein
MKRLLALLLLIGLAAIVVRLLFHVLLERPGPPLLAPVRIDVEPGQTFRQTAEKLEAAGLVPSGEALVAYARLREIDRKVHYGAYEFREPMRPIDLIEKMVSGEVLVFKVTIPEGRTLREITATLGEVGLGDAEEFLALARDPAFARSVGVEADTLEGYLFPETYFFSPYARKAEILGAMVGRFRDAVGRDLAEASAASGLTPHQVVTLASIVEKETGKPDERPLIAAVFRNRLRIGMPLQADPTVIYGIENFDGNLTRRHLETPTEYNTYQRAGLPPGPIASPGREAVRAVLAPADVPYLYFVARDDGSHEFSVTLAEHNRAVNRWQRKRG